MKRKFAGVDEVVCPSKFLAEFYQSRGFFKQAEWNIVACDNGVVLRHMNIVHSPSSIVRFIYVGSLVDHKGIRILMEAWDGIEGKGSRMLHIVGDGTLRKEVEGWSKSKTNVYFHGRLEGDILEEIYNKCDVLIFPSICLENRPTVIIEALERGLRVIASNTGGVSELVSDDSLVEPSNVQKLKIRIESF